MSNETVLIKHRVSALHGTALDLVLRVNGVHQLLVCGVAM
ncbi:MAG TPA: cysteine hydrolase, partial [Solibacterales bacterium]|nr:cysteine hydrolase [Bryobacterales bacterium]